MSFTRRLAYADVERSLPSQALTLSIAAPGSPAAPGLWNRKTRVSPATRSSIRTNSSLVAGHVHRGRDLFSPTEHARCAARSIAVGLANRQSADSESPVAEMPIRLVFTVWPPSAGPGNTLALGAADGEVLRCAQDVQERGGAQ